MSTPTDIRLYNALQKLRGFTKLLVEADGKMKIVRDQAAQVAENQRKIQAVFTKPKPKPFKRLLYPIKGVD